MCSSATAFADDGADDDESEVFRYVEPMEAYPLRAVIEEIGILGLGAAYYFSNHEANSSNLDFEYTWGDLGDKVTEGYAFDMNKFDTNFITHPGAGTLYYWAARGNRLSLPVSFLYTLTASTIWEFFGEFRERTSVNDLFITPISGLVLGESTIQLGAFFDRSCATTANKVWSAVSSPFKRVHDWVDGAQVLRDTECDRHGLSRSGDHEFRLSLGEGVVVYAKGGSDSVDFETSLALRTRVVALRSYGTPGHDIRSFADGNWTEFALRGAVIGTSWSDFGIEARVVPFGLHYRDLDGPLITGHELLLGLSVGVDYSAHSYAGGTVVDFDRLYLIETPGLGLRYRKYSPGLRSEFELFVSPAMGGIETFALPKYLAAGNSIDLLGSTTRENGYDHVGGLSLAPRFRLTGRHIEAGAELKAVQLWGITLLDRYPDRRAQVTVEEAWRKASAWVAVGPLFSLVWPRLWAAALERWGEVADVRKERIELRFGVAADAVF